MKKSVISSPSLFTLTCWATRLACKTEVIDMRMNWEFSGEVFAFHIWQLGQKYTWPPPTPNFSIGVSQIGHGCCFMCGPMAGV